MRFFYLDVDGVLFITIMVFIMSYESVYGDIGVDLPTENLIIPDVL